LDMQRFLFQLLNQKHTVVILNCSLHSNFDFNSAVSNVVFLNTQINLPE